MELRDYTQFATENPVAYLATAEGDQPRVRVFMLWFANEDGFYFAGLQPKSVHTQLRGNPKVEVCFYNNATDFTKAKMMRLTGEVEFVDDLELKRKLLEDRAGYKRFGSDDPADPTYYAFRIHSGEAHFWTMNDILKESQIPRLTF